MAATAASLLRLASGEAEGERGTVRLAASEMVGAEVLPPILGAFRAAHPGVTTELVLSNVTEDLLAGPTLWCAWCPRQARSSHGGSAPPASAFTRTAATSPPTARLDMDALRDHATIGFDTDAGDRALLANGLGFPRDVRFRTDSDLLRSPWSARNRYRGSPARPPGATPTRPSFRRACPDLDIWVVMHEDLRAGRRMRLMFDHLADHLAIFSAQSQP
jgi:DNA-binding transcriptional LysR family regulator